MNNYSKVSVAQDARTELHDVLSLTGAEVSINNLPAGACVPFVHAHKQNEEIYCIVSGPRTTGDGYYECCIKALANNLIEITE